MKRVFAQLLVHPLGMGTGTLATRSSVACAFLLAMVLDAHPSHSQDAGAARDTHPLLPGIRSAELNSPAWPRTQHDKLATGFSPLVLGMDRSPRVWARVPLGGASANVWVLHAEGGDHLLVNDGRLRRVAPDGKVLWTSSEVGELVYFGSSRGERKDDLEPPYGEKVVSATQTATDDVLILNTGRRLVQLDPLDGRTLWSHRFEPAHVRVVARAADVLLDEPGLEVAFALQWGEEGGVINFPRRGQPRFIWQRPIVVPGEYNERYDHGCDMRLDLSVPEQPVVWNVRRYRCRAFDGKTGDMLSSIAYSIGGEQRRNYGPWNLGQGNDGQPLICVVADRVQLHAHGIQLKRQGDNVLAWQHYYGEVYKDAPGAAMEHLAIEDLDGDGATEVAYSVCDPAQGNRSFVRVRDGETGKIECELADRWGVAVFRNVGKARARGLMAFRAPGGTMPQRGELEVYYFRGPGQLELAGKAPRAQLSGRVLVAALAENTPIARNTVAKASLGAIAVPASEGQQLLWRESDDTGRTHLVKYTLADGRLERVIALPGDAPLTGVVQAYLNTSTGNQTLIGSDVVGNLCAMDWSGKTLWELPLQGGATPSLSAADLDGDGHAELVTRSGTQRERVFGFDTQDKVSERANFEHLVEPRAPGFGAHSPLLYDLEGNGRLCLVSPGSSPDDKLVVRAYRGDGSVLWESMLEAPASGVAVVTHAGQFLPGGRAAVAVSLAHEKRSFEGTYLLEGKTGKLLWVKRLHHDGPITMPYRPNGIPTAFDFDGDGAEDIGIDMLSYMAYLRGTDGGFAFLLHTPNIRSDGGTYAGHLYNTYLPVYRRAGDSKPHWLVTAGHGRFGLMNPDPREGVWRVDLDYDVPPNIAVVDVDGDGELEVGYAALNSRTFVCRNAWSGEVEWELELPYPPNSPTITADVDGDGRGEFLTATFCIGTNPAAKGAPGSGKLRWQFPTSLGWAAIADFDGDGLGEIACPGGGSVVVLKAGGR